MAASGGQGLVGYVTDCEGDLARWSRYVELSRVLQRGADGSIELAEGARFVYGGDVVDHAPGDLALLEELVSLKRRYPDRVHLILGNRDINKLRLPTELSELHMQAWPLAEHPGVYFAETAPREKLSSEELSRGGPAERLRWILRDTMGAAKAFESRRQELSARAEGREVDDEKVVCSFWEMAQPGGPLFEYLSLGELAVQIGGTLFVHAGLPRSGVAWEPGWIPGTPARSGLPLSDWLAALEEHRANAVAEVSSAFEAGKLAVADAWSMRGHGGYEHAQPGSALLQYGMRDLPDGSRQPSVVYNGWLDDEYQPLTPDEATLDWLRAGGVQRVVSGHLPHGDAPLTLRLAKGLDAVTADLSYARDTAWEDGRGGSDLACCEVLLGPGEADGRVHGVLSNGMSYEARLDDPVIGSVTADGWRAKGRTRGSEGEEGQLVLSRNSGWKFEARLATEGELEK